MHRVGVALYPGFSFVNLGVVSVFEFANLSLDERRYEVLLLSETGGLVASSAGVEVNTVAFDDSVFDTVIAVGDNDAAAPAPALVAFLKKAATRSRRVCATCTGAFYLAQAGLVHGKRVTTHWFHAARLRKEYPAVRVEEDSIFINDGAIWTSAGATACIDLALAFVEQDAGADMARLVAKKLVVPSPRGRPDPAFGAARPPAALGPDPEGADLRAPASAYRPVGRGARERREPEPAPVQPRVP